MDQYKNVGPYSNMTTWESADCYNIDATMCSDPPIETCEAQPEIYYTLKTFYNFHNFVIAYHNIFDEILNNPTVTALISELAADFPMKVSTGFNPSDLLNVMGSVVSIASAGVALVPGGEGVAGAAGFLGAIISTAGGATAASSGDTDTVNKGLENRVARMWDANVQGSRHFLDRFFKAPDLSEFPGWKPPALPPVTYNHPGYDMDQMKFLDNGAFFQPAQYDQ